MKKSYWTSSIALILLCSLTAWAADPTPTQVILTGAESEADTPQPKEYWLGIEISQLPPALRAHLRLPENQGFVIWKVMPNSPAAKVGIAQNDVILKADGKELTETSDLLQAVAAAKEKQMKLEIIHEGQPKTITITPAKMPVEFHHDRLPQPGEVEALQKWLEDMQKNAERMRQEAERVRNSAMKGTEEEQERAMEETERLQDEADRMQDKAEQAQEQAESEQESSGRQWRFQFIKPGVIIPHGAPSHAPLPSNMTIAITKTGDKPANIVVTKDNEKWEVTEKDLDKLPEEVRGYVEQTLGASRNFGSGAMHFVPEIVVPNIPKIQLPDLSKMKMPAGVTPPDIKIPQMPEMDLRNLSEFQKKFQEKLNKQMEELNQRMEELQKQLQSHLPSSPQRLGLKIQHDALSSAMQGLRGQLKDTDATGKESQATLKELKQQLDEAVKNAIEARRTHGEDSREYIELKEKAGQLGKKYADGVIRDTLESLEKQLNKVDEELKVEDSEENELPEHDGAPQHENAPPQHEGALPHHLNAIIHLVNTIPRLCYCSIV